MKRKLLQSNLIIFSVMLLCMTCFNTFGQQAKKISIQGFLKDGTGKAVADGNQDITFKLYTTETGGTAAWTGTQTVKVTGGVYSAYLGTATNPIDGLNWGSSTYFVGVTVGIDELTPRTELTFAPYSLGAPFADRARLADLATTVVCSGALGDVKYSILNPQQFAAVNGNCWVPMDGGGMSGSKLAAIIGGGNVPNAGGLFLRGQESQNGSTDYDPERSSGSTIASYQGDGYTSHNHANSNTGYAGSHQHSYFDSTPNIYQWNIANGTVSTYLSNNYVAGGSNNSTGPSGDHNHPLNITANGGNETRSKNLNLWTYIRIN